MKTSEIKISIAAMLTAFALQASDANAEIVVNSEGSQVRIGAGGIQVNSEGSDVTIGSPAPQAQPVPAPQAASANCSIPVGTYKYLYSDGYQTYYYNDALTIRATGNEKLLESGDFSYKVDGKLYSRSGGVFRFSNSVGTYTSVNGAPITFSGKGDFAQLVAAAPAGTSHNASEGNYYKQTNGQVSFTPKIQLSDLVIDSQNCGGNVTILDYDYDAVVQDLGAQKVGDNLVVNLDNDILFDFDSASVTAKASETLNQLAYLIQQDRQGLVIVRGHADSKGSDEYNLKLSQDRANAVVNWLSSVSGVAATNFAPQGMGEAFPVAHNTNPDGSDNPEGRAQNRRVEVLIQTVQNASVPEPKSMVQPQTIAQPQVTAPTVSVNTPTAAVNVPAASGVNFAVRTLKYVSSVVVNNAATLSGADTYKIVGALTVNAPVTIQHTANIKVAGRTVVNAPMTLKDKGAMKIAGDLIVAAPITMEGNSSIKSSGSIVVDKNAGGSISQSGNAQVKGAISYK